jgi:hypothetical protein
MRSDERKSEGERKEGKKGINLTEWGRRNFVLREKKKVEDFKCSSEGTMETSSVSGIRKIRKGGR